MKCLNGDNETQEIKMCTGWTENPALDLWEVGYGFNSYTIGIASLFFIAWYSLVASFGVHTCKLNLCFLLLCVSKKGAPNKNLLDPSWKQRKFIIVTPFLNGRVKVKQWCNFHVCMPTLNRTLVRKFREAVFLWDQWRAEQLRGESGASVTLSLHISCSGNDI